MNLKDDASLLLEHILKYSFDEIFITDAFGKILYISPNTETMFGIPSKSMIHKNVYDLEKKGIFSPSVITKVLKTKEQTTVIQKTAQNRTNIISGYPIFDKNGTLVRALSFSRDITEFEHLKRENKQVANAIRDYQKEITRLKKQMRHPFSFKGSKKMEKVYDIISKVADLDVTVLLEGESGVGKNHIAQTIHQISGRKNQPFVEVNCGAISESLIESELFGYEEGAFTGAKKGGKQGYFETAGNGTLFLDEIAELPKNLQVKLLSVLQNQSITRVGGHQKIKLGCRIICATNQNLEQLVKENRFRQDLYFRINVIKVTIPPLRERKAEMLPLIYEIVKEMNTKYNVDKQFSPGAIAWLSEQKWEGNVRELRHFIEKTIITTSENKVDLDHIMAENQSTIEKPTKESTEEMTLKAYIETVEREFILRMYEKYPSSVQLAKKLGISQSTANRKIQKYTKRI